MAHPIACWATPEETEHEMDWVRQFSAAVAPATTGRTYLNFEPGTTIADVKSGFGEEKYERLVALKDTWDPTQPVPVEPQHPADRLDAGGAPAGSVRS